MENSKEEFDVFSNESLDSVEAIDHLPHSYAFEKLMYENRITRTVSYDSNGESFELTREVVNILDDEIDNLLPILQTTSIESLRAKLTDIKEDDGESIRAVEMSFDSGSVSYRISGTLGDTLTYERQGYDRDLPVMSLPEDSYKKLLSMFALNFHTETESYMGDSAGSKIEKAMNESRFSSEESLLMALGNYSGSSSIETVSVFEAPEGTDFFIATLSEGETPHSSAVHNELSLERYALEKTSLHQVQENTVEDSSSKDGSYILVKKSDDTIGRFIHPKINAKEYIQNCVEFHSSIKDGLALYKHLDD